MFVTAVVQNSQIPRQPEQEAELFEAEVGACEMAAPSLAVGRFDQSLQHIECGRLDAVAQEKLLPAGETLYGGNQPQQETVVRFKCSTGRARVIPLVTAAFRFIFRFQIMLLLPAHRRKTQKFSTKGAGPLGTPKRCKDVKI